MRDTRLSQKTKNPIRYWVLGESALIGVVFVCILAGLVLWQVFDIRQNISLIRQNIQGMHNAAVSLNIDTLKEQSSESVDAVHAIHTRLSIFRFVSYLPFIGKQYEASMQMLSDVQHLLEDSERIIIGFDDAVRPARKETGEISFQRLSPEKKRIVIQKLFELLPMVTGIESQISLSIAHFEFIDELSLHPALRAVKKELNSQMRRMQEGMSASRPLLELLPSIAGYPKEKKYLFLLQNNTEVRATGGFIGTYGILKMKDGQIDSFMTDNVYNLDDPASSFLAIDPPPPFLRYFPPTDRHWFLRDSNWFPSFDESARQAEWFYTHEGGKEELDGVVAITPDVLSAVLAVCGPVTIEGREFRADNATDELEFQVERGYYQRGLPASKRKEIIGELTARILDRAGDFSFEQWRQLSGIFYAYVREKHILVYVNDPHLQEIARNVGITGDILQTDGDYFMVIDSNMRSQKTDAVMKKEISYTLYTNEKGDAIGRLKLTYTNTEPPSWKTTTYNDWVRIYVPDGSVFLDAIGVSKNEYSGVVEPVEQSRDHGKTVFSAFFSLPSTSSRSFEIHYQLPKEISRVMNEGGYSLFIQKQSGVSNVKSSVSLLFPSHVENVVSDTAQESQKIDKNSLIFSANMQLDQKIDVTLQSASAK